MPEDPPLALLGGVLNSREDPPGHSLQGGLPGVRPPVDFQVVLALEGLPAGVTGELPHTWGGVTVGNGGDEGWGTQGTHLGAHLGGDRVPAHGGCPGETSCGGGRRILGGQRGDFGGHPHLGAHLSARPCAGAGGWPGKTSSRSRAGGTPGSGPCGAPGSRGSGGHVGGEGGLGGLGQVRGGSGTGEGGVSPPSMHLEAAESTERLSAAGVGAGEGVRGVLGVRGGGTAPPAPPAPAEPGVSPPLKTWGSGIGAALSDPPETS